MLFYLDSNNKKSLVTVKKTNLSSVGWNEKDLENLIANNIERVLSTDSLMTIFQERRGKEEPDILALDSKGKLYIFELKRWISDKENLLQVLRYGQIFGQYDYSSLDEIYQKYNTSGKSLIEEHRDYFNLAPQEELRKEDLNKKQHFVIITDGTDIQTRKAIEYWSKTGLSIESIIYRVFETSNGEKMIEFNTYSPDGDVIEAEEGFYVLNTNYNNDQQDDADMINNKKAAAYYEPWKFKINKIQKGDKVFLYRSGTGIVAIGKGSGIIEKKDYHNQPSLKDEEYYTPLEDFKVLKKPLSASDLKIITQVNYRFMSTIFDIGKENGDKVWNHILNNCL